MIILLNEPLLYFILINHDMDTFNIQHNIIIYCSYEYNNRIVHTYGIGNTDT